MNDLPISFVEQRTYTLAVGQTAAYFKLYEAEGLPLQLEILQRLVGYYSVEVGTLNTVTHLWAYASQEERDSRRARLLAHPGWQAYWAQARSLIVSQRSTFLKPAPFFAPRLADMLGTVRAAPLVPA